MIIPMQDHRTETGPSYVKIPIFLKNTKYVYD